MRTENPWQDVLIEALVVWGIYTKAHEDDPRKALTDLLGIETRCALDPVISPDALALLQKGYDKAIKCFVEAGVSETGETLYKRVAFDRPVQVNFGIDADDAIF